MSVLTFSFEKNTLDRFFFRKPSAATHYGICDNYLSLHIMLHEKKGDMKDKYSI